MHILDPRELDGHRFYVIVMIALLVFSGLVLSSSASGEGPVYAKTLQIFPSPFLTPPGVAIKSIKVIESGGGGPFSSTVTPKSIQASVSGLFGYQSESAAMTTRAIETFGPVQFPSGGVAIRTGTMSSPLVAQDGGPVLQSGIISSSGQEVTVTALPNGVYIFSTSNSIGSGQVPQNVQFIFKTSTGTNDFQPSYSSMSTVTAAIPGLWLDSSKRRSRSQIYVEILELMKRGPMTPFEIAFFARLNHKRTKEYAEFLRRSGYLESREEDGKSIYVLTKNGLGFLDRIRSLFQESQLSNEIPNIDYDGFPIR